MTEKFLTYRGNIKAVAASGGSVVFVTVHPEGQPTALYRLDAGKLTLAADPLPCGGNALVIDGASVWVAGTDGRLYQGTLKGGKPAAVGEAFAAAGAGLALLSNERLGVLVGEQLLVVSRKDGKVLQVLTLPAAGSAVAADPTGQWVAVGTAQGNVSVFESEDRPTFEPSATDKLHEGAVTALLFEADDLRFFSAGADQKLLTTHARGRLEPEDKGRGGNHTDQVNALVWGPQDRFFSGSRDKTVKSWPRATNLRPTTLKDGVVTVVGLAVVELHKRSQLVVACDDNSLRFFAIDDEGKVGEYLHKIQDAYARARSELNRDETPRREAALRELAGYDDTPAIELIAQQVQNDADHGLRLLGAQLLGASKCAKATKLLEKCLSHADEAVRVAGFEGLRKQLGGDDLRPIDLALKADKADVGKLAVQALEKLASKDDQALARLIDAINVQTWEVRQAALAGLEKVYEAESSPEPNLIALGSKHADLRRLTLVRLFQRKLLQPARVQSVLRLRTEDPDPEVRRMAFLLSLYTRPGLVRALRDRDGELHRQLTELEMFGQGPSGSQGEARTVEAEHPAFTKVAGQIRKLGERAAHEDSRPDIEEADYSPLLQATASRSLDTSLRGARGLAVLHDPRAFGLLLQLSRESDPQARVEVCRAMAALEDARGIKRLRSLLYDQTAAVRDAAFTSLAHLYSGEPLQAAESGLTSSHEDVRRRGLEVLMEQVRMKPPRGEDEPTWQLLLRALNDSFPSVRGEAFKAALNLKIGGGGGETLRFVLHSIHADVRREVLNEVTAQVGEPWAWGLLLTFFNDPDPALRAEAFAFAVKRSKELEPLDAGLCSRHVDVRRAAVHALVKKHTKAAQELLLRTLGDQEKEIRQLALSSLIDDDAQPALIQALDSSHDDVRARAAVALARHGSPHARKPLLDLATVPEPEQQERVQDWSALVGTALEGLAELGDPAAVPSLVPILESRHAHHRTLAARALVTSVRQDGLDVLRQAMQHADPSVKYQAALGLAFHGDPLVASLVFSEPVRAFLLPLSRMVAAMTLGPAGEDQLAVFLDDLDETVRKQAVLLMMLLEWKDRRAEPTRCLACLSSQMPRARLTAARALEAFSDPQQFGEFVVGLFNDRGEQQAWKVPAETVGELAELIAHGDVPARVASAHLLALLNESEQSAFDQAWGVHRKRYAKEIEALTRKARAVPAARYSPEQLQQLAFGAYVGLVREQGGQQVVRVRLTAINRLFALASADPAYARAARPVLTQTLNDPMAVMRQQAFDYLRAMRVESAALGAEALETGHVDLGVKGLELLSEEGGTTQGEAVLEEALLTRKDQLAEEAGKLLIARRGTTPVAARALNAAHEPLRSRAVQWLAGEYEKDEAARKELRAALHSRYQKVREEAAFALALKKDAAAFEALVKLLAAAVDQGRQLAVVQSLVALGDPRTADALLDRVENDPGANAHAMMLFANVGLLRRRETAERLFAMAERKPNWRRNLFDALTNVSGHDQDILDEEDENPDRKWEKEQHPRHDDILARLMEKCLAVGDLKRLDDLMPAARWSRGKDVDPVLVTLTHHSGEDLRRSAVEAYAWRVRKRGAAVEPLLKALASGDPVTQFFAAEGLARVGRGEGFGVLMAGVEFLEDSSHRARAVLALGELGDPRALELLLKIASQEDHQLQENAAEAVGHMARSGRAEEIFKLLERSSRAGSRVAPGALRGLRWYNTHDAWQLLRQYAADQNYELQDVAAAMLGEDDSPATRELLLKLLSGSSNYWLVQSAALPSARKLWGPESLEPDYAAVQNRDANAYTLKEIVERIGEKGDPGKILSLLPRCNPDCRDELARAVLTSAALPVEAAVKAVEGDDARTVQLAAQILGRARPGGVARSGDRATTAEVEKALGRWRGVWEERRRRMHQENRDDEELTALVSPCLRALAWAAGRLGVGRRGLVEMVRARADDPVYREVRRAALIALAAGEADGEVVELLEQCARGSDPELRPLAAETLARVNAGRATALAGQVLDDRASFDRLSRQPGVEVGEALKAAARQAHRQGVALPALLERRDFASLAAVAGDRSLSEAARLGGIEGLALLGSEEAEGRLLAIGQDEGEEEEVRKAAWRALRRSRRMRKRGAGV